MSLLRSEKEAALHELLVACRESIDLHEDSAQIVDDPEVAGAFRRIAGEREPFIPRLEQLIVSLGDMPSVPDTDRETGEKLLNRLHASMAGNSATEMVRLRMETERQFALIIDSVRATVPADHCGGLLEELSDHSGRAYATLRGFSHD